MGSRRTNSWLFHHLLEDSAEKYPDDICLISKDENLSYKEVYQKTKELAGFLLSNGLKKGDRVALYFEKSIQETITMLAISLAGGIGVNINASLKTIQVEHILSDSGAKFFVSSRFKIATVREPLQKLDDIHTIVIEKHSKHTSDIKLKNFSYFHWDDNTHGIKGDSVYPSVSEHDPATIMYTSGSTGNPKGVVFSHRNILDGARIISEYIGIDKQDRLLSILPFNFDYGLNQLTTVLLTGATLVLVNYLTPQDIINSLRKYQITGLAGIPTLWTQLAKYDWVGDDFKTLRYITNSGGKFPEILVREYRKRIPKVKIFLMYGLTEAFRSTYLDPAQIDVRPTSIGKAIPNVEILILNEENKICKPGEIGELVHRGALVSLGYWNNEEKTTERFRLNPLQNKFIKIPEIVVFSGDLVKSDEEGYIYFVGRKDNMIKTSGFRVSPTEVEEVFYTTDKVHDVVAFGIPDYEKGEAIKVILTLKNEDSIGADDLLKLVSKIMPVYMVPKAIEIRKSLPRTSNGKIDRSNLIKEELEKINRGI